ncbi:UDP-3-O-(3-hydroxymyristoyl)glucosamine N-acyltransferase [Alkalilimnicola ehrlichii]|uniref:UDP-3-O-(3-hydroxymyristoyl)glucosamine N-acyltransferase n=1 Tax=Alkalilimnicola ehrlichii TaxID=351052 RepID=UPI002163B4FF|nr:UDP-3-O-(3-hydroxymyristoyl)glucosamine N-acyltransferase [Alkalilimnicola ehrlichii]
MRAARASAVILDGKSVDDCPTAALVTDNPYYIYARVAQLLNPMQAPAAGIASSAFVHPKAVLGEAVSIGPHAVIEAGARLGDRVVVGPGAVIGSDAVVGEACILGPNVVVAAGVVLGCRVRVHGGAVLGADGFGFARGPDGWAKVPQLGGLRIGNDVDIGANSTIDRGALDDTVIEDDVKIDNLVQIGHNVRVGKHTVLAGCAGVAGSTTIGENCLIGGATAVAGHLEIASGVTLTGMTGVTGSIDKPGMYSSVTPVAPTRQWRKNAVRFNHLDEMYRRLKALEQELAELKGQASEQE